GDAGAHVVRGAGSRAWRYPARVRLHAPIETLAERLAPAAGLLSGDGDGDGTTVLETGAESLHDLAGFLGSLDVPFTVLEPAELRDHLRVLARRYTTAAENTTEDTVEDTGGGA
ncbi:MAG: WYL domain-containing protein, partial [Spirillospora sp.]